MTRRFNFAVPAFVAIAVLYPRSNGLTAQERTLPDGPATGASVDRFIYEGAGITAVSFRYTGLQARRVGSEIGVSLFPDALSAGALYLATDLGAAYSAPGAGFSLLFKGGLSTLTALGGGFAFEPGFHFGTGMIVQTGKRSGVRLDVIRHYYLIDNETEGLWSVGLGFTALGRKSKPNP
ncbi:MAG: hypothetical protein ACJ8A6_12700 [Gemmatimonadales bacterium]